MPSPTAWRVRLEPFLEILFPTRCAGCGSARVVWCDGCRSRLLPISSTVCLACRRIFPAGAAGDRWANVDGAFAADPSLVRDETVLLIDDVHTTGATLAACSQALAQAGARRVVGLTLGRA